MVRSSVTRIAAGVGLAGLNAVYLTGKLGTVTQLPLPFSYAIYLAALGLIVWGGLLWQRAEQWKRNLMNSP